MTGTGALPDEVETRARRRRARLTPTSVEIAELDDVGSITDATDIVLLTATLPSTATACEQWLRRLRDATGPMTTLWVLAPNASASSSTGADRITRRLRNTGRPPLRQRTVPAIRAAGWTVTAVHRFEVLGSRTREWVDIEAKTIGPGSSGEGDRDERSEKRDHQQDA